MKVCKFGGTSMATAETIKQVETIIKADDERKFIVVSAPGKRNGSDEKVTDLLYRLKKEYDGGGNFKEVFDTLENRFFEIAQGLEVDVGLKEEFERLKDTLAYGVDYVVSRGEYLSGKLLAKRLDFPFVDAKDLVRFDGNTLDFNRTIVNLKATLSKCKTAVIPGFYGENENGEIRTFSRGGSDITGALVANAVDADVYENWTDVDGIYSADPRKDKNAKLIERLGFEDMFERANSGANVLHKDAVYPAQQKAIPINVRNTFNPSCEGTLITS